MRSVLIIAALPLLAQCGPRAENTTDRIVEAASKPAVTANATDVPPAGAAANATTPVPAVKPITVSACLMQGGERLDVAPLRAVGTEPFWGASVEGRCVTYSTPDDQIGTRVWTRYAAGPDGGGTWTGQFGGKSFVMRTERQVGCSDGMSDKSYRIGVELTVLGEKRVGCAESR